MDYFTPEKPDLSTLEYQTMDKKNLVVEMFCQTPEEKKEYVRDYFFKELPINYTPELEKYLTIYLVEGRDAYVQEAKRDYEYKKMMKKQAKRQANKDKKKK
jgi:hypothetical protein